MGSAVFFALLLDCGASRLKTRAAGRSSLYATAPPLSRASSLPHWISHIGSLAGTKSVCTAKSVGASLLAMTPAHPTSPQTDPPLSCEQARSHRRNAITKEPGRLQGRLAVDVDFGAPLPQQWIYTPTLLFTKSPTHHCINASRTASNTKAAENRRRNHCNTDGRSRTWRRIDAQSTP